MECRFMAMLLFCPPCSVYYIVIVTLYTRQEREWNKFSLSPLLSLSVSRFFSFTLLIFHFPLSQVNIYTQKTRHYFCNSTAKHLPQYFHSKQNKISPSIIIIILQQPKKFLKTYHKLGTILISCLFGSILI